jgi:DNA (cytosine-5)-methyltransferase 1
MVAVISLFCGCGGSSLGYKRANCNIVLATDFNPRALTTYSLNFPDTKVLLADIRTLNLSTIQNLTNLKAGELDILDGSPPCTPFSLSGDRQRGWGKSIRHAGESNLQLQTTNDLFYEYIRIVKELKPKTFVAENVRGLIIGKAKGYFLDIIKKMRELDYDVQAFDVNAKDFEVAQSRPRIIITGIRNDIIQVATKLKKHPIITFYEAMKDLIIPSKDIEILKQAFLKSSKYQFQARTKQGHYVSDYTFNKSYAYNFVRANLNQPSPTILAHSRQIIHPTQNRWLTLAEVKRLASFPDDFKFLSENDGYIRIGNSVPPNLIKNIALYVIQKAQLDCPSPKQVIGK